MEAANFYLEKGAMTLKNVVRRLIAEGLSRLPKGLFTDLEFFPIYERRGIHMTPASFYFPVPVLSELDELIWTTESEMVGIDMNLDDQERLMEDLAKENYFREYFALNADPLSPPGVYSRNVGYGGIDGAMLYSIIRLRKPRRIIEIGSGNSTLLAILAARKNQEEGAPPCHITAIEPYPASYLRDALAGSGEILQRRVETVSLDRFIALEQNDVLFIDSSTRLELAATSYSRSMKSCRACAKAWSFTFTISVSRWTILASLLSRSMLSGQNNTSYRRSLPLTPSTGCCGAFLTCRPSDGIYCASIFRIII